MESFWSYNPLLISFHKESCIPKRFKTKTKNDNFFYLRSMYSHLRRHGRAARWIFRRRFFLKSALGLSWSCSSWSWCFSASLSFSSLSTGFSTVTTSAASVAIYVTNPQMGTSIYYELWWCQRKIWFSLIINHVQFFCCYRAHKLKASSFFLHYKTWIPRTWLLIKLYQLLIINNQSCTVPSWTRQRS